MREPRGDRGQVRLRRLDLACRSAERAVVAQERLLDDVLGLADAPEHPVGDREQQRAQPRSLGHVDPQADDLVGHADLGGSRRRRGELRAGSRRASSARRAPSRARAWPSRSTSRGSRVIIETPTSPAASRAEPGRERARRPGAPSASARYGSHSRDRRRIVVDDVVDAAARRARRAATVAGGGVVDVDERPDRRRRRRRAATCACGSARASSSARRCRGRRSCRSAARCPRRRRVRRPPARGGGSPRATRAGAAGGFGVERIVLGLHRAAAPRVGPAGVALRDEPPDADRLGGGEQVVGALACAARSCRRTPRSKCRRSPTPASAVIWWTITSGSARATASPTGAGVEPVHHRPASRRARAARRASRRSASVPTTSCPRSTSCGTSRRPITPLAPATKTRIA